MFLVVLHEILRPHFYKYNKAPKNLNFFLVSVLFFHNLVQKYLKNGLLFPAESSKIQASVLLCELSAQHYCDTCHKFF